MRLPNCHDGTTICALGLKRHSCKVFEMQGRESKQLLREVFAFMVFGTVTTRIGSTETLKCARSKTCLCFCSSLVSLNLDA